MKDTPAPSYEKTPDEKAFESQLPQLIVQHPGKFALFHAGKLEGVFDTMEAAYDTAIDRFALDPVFIGPIVKHQPVQSAPALQHGLLHADL